MYIHLYSCCNVLQCFATRCGPQQRVAESCSVLQCDAVPRRSRLGSWQGGLLRIHMLQRVAACCSVLQRVAACCSVLQCAAVCYRDMHLRHSVHIYTHRDLQLKSSYALSPPCRHPVATLYMSSAVDGRVTMDHDCPFDGAETHSTCVAVCCGVLWCVAM